MDKYNWIMLIFTIAGILLIILLVFTTANNISKCKNAGYSYMGYGDNLEPDYLKCCNTVYVNHKGVEECDIINVK